MFIGLEEICKILISHRSGKYQEGTTIESIKTNKDINATNSNGVTALLIGWIFILF